MTSATGFIPDGYTVPGTIKARPKVHETVTISYRPATVEERTDLFDRWDDLDADDRMERGAKFLEKHLTEWDLRAPNGDPVEITHDSLRRLTFDLYGSLLNMVCGVPEDRRRERGERSDEKN